ncbi:MAG TPA: hypothetical protein VIL26_03170 [Clostridia bacterium]
MSKTSEPVANQGTEKEVDKFDTFRNAFEKNLVKNKEIPQASKQAASVVESIRDFADQTKLEKMKRAAFEKDAVKVVNQNAKKTLFAHVNMTDKTLFYRISDPVGAGDRLLNLDNNQLYIIKSVSSDRMNKKFKYEDAEYEIWCNVATFEIGDSKPDNSEDISKLLDDLENSINKARDGFVIKRKPEALRLFKFFKNCVLNGEKEEKLFKDFIDALNLLSPYLPAAAQRIIFLMDH